MSELPASNTPMRVLSKIRHADSCSTFNVVPKLIQQRRPGSFVRYLGPVPGCGGDVWLCEHLDGKRAAYLHSELEWYHSPAVPNTVAFDKDCDCVKCQNVRSAL